jgi:hypothetical protein
MLVDPVYWIYRGLDTPDSSAGSELLNESFAMRAWYCRSLSSLGLSIVITRIIYIFVSAAFKGDTTKPASNLKVHRATNTLWKKRVSCEAA